MPLHYLSILNRNTTTLNFTCNTDPTTALLKVTGGLTPRVYEEAKFIVTDGVLIKRTGQYPKGNVGERLSDEQLLLLEQNYSKTTTKHLDNSLVIEAILK